MVENPDGKDQFPKIDGNNRVLYLGLSMNPTLKDLDIVEFVPYKDREIKRGDIVVIQPPDEGDTKVIHRIVMVQGQAIITQGDNNLERDREHRVPSAILGYVTSVRRRNQHLKIQQGMVGYIRFLWIHSQKKLHADLLRSLRYPYQWLYSSESVIRVFSRFLNYRTVVYDGSEKSEIQLFIGPFQIGRLRHGSTSWEIMPPFRLMIDPSLLPPSHNNESSGFFDKN